jgi:hypothetical protein
MGFRRAFVWLAVLAILWVEPTAKAQSYVSSILYPLTVPNGFSASFSQLDSFVGQTVGFGGNTRAILWTAGGPTDLTPTNLNGGINYSQVNSTDGVNQVGWGVGSETSSQFHAMLWTGSASTAVDLNPTNLTGFVSSVANGASGTEQVGYGASIVGLSNTSNNYRALLWEGTSASAVDLTPINLGITTSQANGTDGTREVGWGSGIGTGNSEHAILWSGSSTGAVDLNPTSLGVSDSDAVAIAGIQQVGYGVGNGTNGFRNALLWTGTAISAVDLNPSFLGEGAQSSATGSNGFQQVGYGSGSGTGYDVTTNAFYSHALLWTGTADSAIDLQAFLPLTGTWIDSTAYSVDSNGNIYGTADGTYNNVTGTFAVEWSTVPEPASIGLIGFTMLLFRRPARIMFAS